MKQRKGSHFESLFFYYDRWQNVNIAIMTGMIHFHIITLFPEVLEPYLDASIIGRGKDAGKIRVSFHNPRDFTRDKHRKADERAYGGGPGMVMKAEPILRAVQAARGRKKDVKIILLSASGKQFTDKIAGDIQKKFRHVILICGHYEGVDARVKKITGAEEISVGPYVLTGGEIPALILTDSIARKVPGVLGNEASLEEKRAASPEVYTRPEKIKNGGKTYGVPDVLLSGDHKQIESWRQERKTQQKRS